MQSKKIKILAAAALLAVFALSSQAGEGIFGWVYTLDLQPKGKAEFEQRANWNHQQNGEYNDVRMKSEIEYGLTDNIQLGGYINFQYVNAYQNDRFHETGGALIPESINTSNRYRNFRYDSASVEAIWRIMNPVTDSFGLGIYVEPEIGPNIKELEARLLLQKNLIDDRLILAANLAFVTERDSVANKQNPEKASHFDLLLGASYRFASNWSAGFDYRYHNDFAGYFYQEVTQHAHFIGPNLHYANANWWATAAMRHQLGGTCHNAGELECANGYVLDDHGHDELILKVGIPF